MASELKVRIENAEIRGVEEKEGRIGKDGSKGLPFLVVRIDDEAGNRHELIDRDVENRSLYQRGKFCDIIAVVKYGYGKDSSWVRFEMRGIEPVDAEGV